MSKVEQEPLGALDGMYTAKDMAVLEGLDPVRKRPGMFIGSTGPQVCTTSSGRSSTTLSTKLWQVTATAST